ncbi:MAG: hypothetical protein R3219_01160 [Hydrogenovibrio sp.]|nr:hypothetical protein [Hydrogenovibrio sp.]
MSIKEPAKKIIDDLPEDATWNDLVKSLIREKKITLGLTDIEIAQKDFTEAELSSILSRLDSASSTPDDMRNTKHYNPGNAATMGILFGVIAIFMAFVFPPISWGSAVIAAVAGIVGLKRHEEKAWVGILLAMVSIVPMFFIG